MKAERIPFSLDSAENVKYMKKKIAGILICVLIVFCGWNVTVRELNQAGKKDLEYKENNANARAQSSDGQNVTLEDVLQEAENVVYDRESDIGSENGNITGDSGNSLEQNENANDNKKTDADDNIKTDLTNGETDVTENTTAEDMIIKDQTASDETTVNETAAAEAETTEVETAEDSYKYETGYIFLGDSRFYLMNEECKIEDIPNFFVVSCPGMGYAWLADTAFPKVQSLQRQHTEIKNWVVICGLGVNDLTSVRSYLNKYRRWPDSSRLYLLSVNPTKTGAPARCSNQRIEAFNNRIKKVENAAYIDCYRYLTRLGFGTKGDGLHYDAATNWAIYSYILEKLNKDAGGDPVTETECQARAKKYEKQLSQKNY